MQEEIKLCKDCKFYVELHEMSPEPSVCKRPTEKVSPVTGEIIYVRRNPYLERNSDPKIIHACGTMGKYFEPKEVDIPIKEKVINFFKNIRQDNNGKSIKENKL